MNKKTPLCETKGVWKNYPQSDGLVPHILDKMDVQVYPKEILAIIGPSGCGKSTFIRIFSGLIPASGGHIYYHGKQVRGLMPNLAFVFQNFALFPWMTVQQNIEIALEALELPPAEIQTRTAEAIALIGLSGFEEAYPREISGGMKQRVGLARALVCDPEILILDEPFSELDTFTAETLRKEVLNIWANTKTRLSSIVIISHDVREVAFLADRILMMDAKPGRIRFVMKNRLPRPRDYHSKEFLHLVDELHDSYIQEELNPIKPTAPLLPVHPDEILGLLGHLRKQGASNDLYRISAGSMDRFDHVLLVAQAADFLDFVEISKRTISLTELGKKFLSADVRARRIVWKEKIEKMPLFRAILEKLNSNPKHRLSYAELSHLIKKELPTEETPEQCRIAIKWGSYGHLFTYNKRTKTLMLK